MIITCVPKEIHEGVDAIINFDKDAAITIVTNAINGNNDYATGNSLFMYQPWNCMSDY
jgi:hypothetical protein